MILGIRPEHIDLVEAGGVEFKVQTVELLGAERLLYGKVGDETSPCAWKKANLSQAR